MIVKQTPRPFFIALFSLIAAMLIAASRIVFRKMVYPTWSAGWIRLKDRDTVPAVRSRCHA